MADLNQNGPGCQWPFRRADWDSARRCDKVSNRFDSIEESERVWLDAKRRSAARRSWILIGVLVLVAIFLAWLATGGRSGADNNAATTTTTAEQRVLADGQQALADWGRFAVTNDLGVVKRSFWADGPQYKQLAEEAKSRDKALGPPPYNVTMTGVQVLSPRSNQRVLRGRVMFTRSGEEPQSYAWDVWMRREGASGEHWRLWTVRETVAR
jgi:hypothetical protein